MIGTNDAAGMSYHEYKVELWRRLVGFWKDRIGSELFAPGYVEGKIEHCGDMYRSAKRNAGVAKR